MQHQKRHCLSLSYKAPHKNLSQLILPYDLFPSRKLLDVFMKLEWDPRISCRQSAMTSSYFMIFSVLFFSSLTAPEEFAASCNRNSMLSFNYKINKLFDKHDRNLQV